MTIFSRNIGSITVEQQRQLKRKSVSVIGCGGLGGHVIDQLVRLGVGTVHCFDPDNFSLSNCNRQLYATAATLGQNKAQAAAERAAAISSCSKVIPFPVDYRQAAMKVVRQIDAVVDCIDDIPARLELAELCRQHERMLVHGAVSGWVGQVGIQAAAGSLYKRLYPAGAADKNEPLSVLACTVAMVAALQVSETLKILLQLPVDLEEKTLFIDLRQQEFIRCS
ncbi:MAG: thiamine biosynthesis protein ThiF [Desulfobulbus propionicus]|nr:MAG: thiamine biosynthesis protein ThiF [Desulfobulbus propionicus]